MIFDSTALVILLALFAVAAILFWYESRRLGAQTGKDIGAHPRPQSGPSSILLVSAWFGLVAGVIHLGEAIIQRFGRGHFVFAGPAMLWMTPLAYVLIFVGFGVLLAIAAYAAPQWLNLNRASLVLAWLTVFSLLLPFVQIYKVASALLAAGAAVQIARMMGRHQRQWLSIMKKSGMALAFFILALAASVHGAIWAAETLSLRKLTAAPVGKPNVLLVVMDTVRASNLSLYGYDRSTTPFLEQIGSQGAVFDKAMSTAPWTLKSHATMFTGLYPSQVPGGFEEVLRIKEPLLAEIFKEQGYLTGGFVANLLYTSYESGLTPGFIHYDDFHVSLRQVLFHSWIAHTPVFRRLFLSRSLPMMARALFPPKLGFEGNSFHNTTFERKPADQITNAFLAWQKTAGNRPFFAFLNYFDAHQPFESLPPRARTFDSPDRKAVNKYDAQIAYIDSEIGRMLDDLQRQGVLENTIVVITSDHGEQFGEHGLEEHANSLYLQLLHVPLVIRYPAKVPKGLRVAEAVTLRDLAATIMDLAGLPPQTPGVSFGRFWNGNGSAKGSPIVAELDRVVRPQETEPSRFGPMQAAFDDKFHYIRRGDGEEELYAYEMDVDEEHNLSNTPEGKAALTRLRELSKVR